PQGSGLGSCTRCKSLSRPPWTHPPPATESAEVRQCKQDAIMTLIGDVTAMAAGYGLQNIVCILPDHNDLEGLQSKCHLFASNPHLDILATDPYPLWYRRDIATTQVFCEALFRACQHYNKAAQMWIQGFGVPAGQEWQLGEEMRLMARCGINDIAIWSYLATSYMSSHTCADAPRVWEVFTRTMQELRC